MLCASTSNVVCAYQSVGCAFMSPVSIESGMLVMCRMQCLCPRYCSVRGFTMFLGGKYVFIR